MVKKGLKKPVDSALIKEIQLRNEKFTQKDIVAVARDRDGKAIWLEKGNDGAGRQHIMRHANEFEDMGIRKDDIVECVMNAASAGKLIGYQNTRPVYEIDYKGSSKLIAVDVGSNGFVVGANPTKMKKVKKHG